MIHLALTKLDEWLSTSLGQAILLWLCISLAGAILKPRSPEAYARLAAHWPKPICSRVAAFLQLVGAWGIDYVKVGTALAKIVTGRFASPDAMHGTDDEPPPSGGGGGSSLQAIVVAHIEADASPPASDERTRLEKTAPAG